MTQRFIGPSFLALSAQWKNWWSEDLHMLKLSKSRLASDQTNVSDKKNCVSGQRLSEADNNTGG